MRDLRNVGGKLKVVLMPSEKQEGVLQKLRDCALCFSQFRQKRDVL